MMGDPYRLSRGLRLLLRGKTEAGNSVAFRISADAADPFYVLTVTAGGHVQRFYVNGDTGAILSSMDPTGKLQYGVPLPEGKRNPK